MEVRFVLLPRRSLDLFDHSEVAEPVAKRELGLNAHPAYEPFADSPPLTKF